MKLQKNYIKTQVQQRFIHDIDFNMKKCLPSSKITQQQIKEMFVQYQYESNPIKKEHLRMQLLATQYKLIYKLAVNYLNRYPSQMEIDDVVATMFYHATIYLDKYNPEKANLSTFLQSNIPFLMLNTNKDVGRLVKLPTKAIAEITKERKRKNGIQKQMDKPCDIDLQSTTYNYIPCVDTDGNITWYLPEDLTNQQELQVMELDTTQETILIEDNDEFDSPLKELMKFCTKREQELVEYSIVNEYPPTLVGSMVTPQNASETTKLLQSSQHTLSIKYCDMGQIKHHSLSLWCVHPNLEKFIKMHVPTDNCFFEQQVETQFVLDFQYDEILSVELLSPKKGNKKITNWQTLDGVLQINMNLQFGTVVTAKSIKTAVETFLKKMKKSPLLEKIF